MPKHTNFEKHKARKKELNEELTPVASHQNRWWDWCVSEDEKNELDPMFIELLLSLLRWYTKWED